MDPDSDTITDCALVEVLRDAPIGISIARATVLLWANQKYASLFGYDSPTELLGRSFLDLVAPEYRDEVRERASSRESGARSSDSYEVEGIRKDGTLLPYHVEATRLDLRGGPGTVAFLTETGDRIAADLRLRASREHYRSLFNHSPVSLWEEDFSEVKKYLDSLVESGVSDLRAHFGEHPSALIQCLTLAKVVDVNDATLRMYKARDVTEFATRMGEVVDPAYYLEFAESALSLYEGDTFFEREVKNRTLTGEPLDVVVRAFVAPGHEATMSRVLVSIMDMTRRKQAEEALRKHEEQALHAQRMEAIGRLAGGVAHDFNNLLTTIAGYTGILLDSAPIGERGRVELQHILRAAEQGASLTRQLLAFGRKEPRTPQTIDLVGMLEGMHGMLERVVGTQIRLTTRLSADTPSIEADRAQIEQVVLNLVANARDAMSAGGALAIEVGPRRLEAAEVFGDGSLPPGDYAELSFRDTGLGVLTEFESRVFEPFFTTKPRGGGTGLGLSTVHGIVVQSGGGVRLENQPGDGALFRILLPAAARRTPTASPSDPNRPIDDYAGSETILLAEDEPTVRALMTRVLERLGYTVVAGANGFEALSLASELAIEIDLLVTDLMMPVMNGRELAESMRKSRPALPVVFATGYADDEAMPKSAEGSNGPLLRKPFSPLDLARCVRETLDARTPPAH